MVDLAYPLLVPLRGFESLQSILQISSTLDMIPPSFYFPIRDSDNPQESVLDTKNLTGATVLFFFLQIFGGHLGIPFVLLTVYLTAGVRRHAMLLNFLISWVIYTTSFCILLYIGKQFGPEPPRSFCAIQASLIYGTAVLTPTAGLSFVLNLWFSLQAVSTGKAPVDDNTFKKYTLIAAPYIIFAFFVIFTATYAASNPELLTRTRYVFYCTIHSNFVNIVPAVAAMIMLSVVIFEILIAIKIYRIRKSFSQMRSQGPPLHLVIRVGIFSTYSFLSIVACVGFWAKTGDELPYMIQASLPTAAFLIFGSQKDLMEIWGLARAWSFVKHIFGFGIQKIY
ncbi:hypothetical protein PNOK_0439100 [Pyrrhoderma noxium]|uniref:G-protein coupled receptors family 1 profile domain-containing protein n=1 Tax=Pyrrhoderma noxium TaxID=2282107 RepID=A0A286UIP3_9AGAM|nr:hypothetical protein PNOK_0439100 [Pyrrhoderma noxium]